MTSDLTACDSWIVATKDELCVICTLGGLEKKKNVLPWQSGRLTKKLTVLEFRYIQIKGLSAFRIEELISSCRVIAANDKGDDILLFSCGFSCKNRMYSFCECLEDILQFGDIDEDRIRKRHHISSDRPFGNDRPIAGPGGPGGPGGQDKPGGPRPGSEPDDDVCPKCGRKYADPKRKICAHCMNKTMLIKKMLPFMKRYLPEILLVLLTIVLNTGLMLLSPYVSQKIFYDEVLAQSGSMYGKIGLALAVIVGSKLLSEVASMVNGIINGKVSARVTYDLKKTIFSNFGRLSLSFFTSRQTGSLMTQVNNDATTIYWFFCDGMPFFMRNILQLAGILILLFSLSPVLTLTLVGILPVFGLFYVLSMNMFKKMYARNYAKHRSLNSTISDVLTGFRIVKVFSREERENERFDRKNNEYASSNLKIAVRENTIYPAFDFIIKIASYIIWFVGGILVVRGASGSLDGISYGTLMLFISYIAMIYDPIRFLAEFSGNWARCFNAMQRLFEVMDTETEVKETKNPVKLGEVRGRVEFDHVGFSYVKNKKTIDDVSFVAEEGKTLGIVGHTGAGKSTLINLLTRLYDVEEGAIRVDGVDIRDISFEDLHNAVAIVSQETFLFRGTILDNIRYAKPEATELEVLEASKLAGAHSFIVKYPDGYNTEIGNNNRELSGGEKQRISIARAILKNPRILILDEATAAMDTQTERQIQAALSEITRGRTTIIIAHRLSTLRDADKLIVIENGKMTETGTHSELIRAGGAYFNLYKMQLQALKTIGIEE
ncbi:MAG: ABC transporter ATP-binding protein [Firmicutes bacterium]|nr:ABC transporter ATP-binding protein [Bacillota bacterium]